MRTLFSDKTGPQITYERREASRGTFGILYVQTLNPDLSPAWFMSRWELFVFGLKAMIAAVRS